MQSQSAIKPIHSEELAKNIESLSHSEELAKKIGSLWQSGKFSDFAIVTKSKTFPVHKAVLGVQSSILAKIFDENAEATEMNVQDFSEDAVENLLIFMYTGEAKKSGNEMECVTIASKFDLPRMINAYGEILTEKLKTNPDLSTAYEIFNVAYKNSYEELKLQAFKTITTFFPEKLSEDLLNDPDLLKKLNDAKVQYDLLLHRVNDSKISPLSN